jgi:hypothetical protein
MSSTEIIEKFKSIERDKHNAIIKKRGIDIIVTPLLENTQDLSDVDIISSEYDVDTIGSKQYEPTKKTFGDEFETRMLVVETDSEWKKLANDEFERFSNDDDTDDFNQTNNNLSNAIILHDRALRVGSKIRLKADENTKYTISKVYKKRAITDLFRYRLVRD